MNVVVAACLLDESTEKEKKNLLGSQWTFLVVLVAASLCTAVSSSRQLVSSSLWV